MENNTEFSLMVLEATESNKKAKSDYFAVVSNQNFGDFVQPIKDTNSELLLSNKKANIEARSIEEKTFICNYMNQPQDFIVYLKKFIKHLIDERMYYRVFDYFMFLFNFNKKSFLNVVVRILIYFRKIRT